MVMRSNIWSRAVFYLFLLTFSLALSTGVQAQGVIAVDSIGFTVSDMDRSVAFYSDVLTFKKVSDAEVDGPEYDQLWGVFGVRARIVGGAHLVQRLGKLLRQPDCDASVIVLEQGIVECRCDHRTESTHSGSTLGKWPHGRSPS